jgi:hypothetical protein
MSWDDRTESLEAFRTERAVDGLKLGSESRADRGHSTPINSTMTKPVQLMTIGYGGEPTELRKDH